MRIQHRVGVIVSVGFCLAGLAPAVTAAQAEAPPEHPVIKPMEGAAVLDGSRVDEFGQLSVRYRAGGQSVTDTVDGRFWHLEYQLDDRATSRDEILANYAAEATRLGGDILNRTGTRLLFRVTRRDGGVSWGLLDARSRGAYELEIVDEAGLDLSLEFDADAMMAALDRDGRLAVYGILFAIDRADLRVGSGEVLDTIASVLDRNPGVRLEVQGHTDATGTPTRNRQLSLERARTVVSALVLYGIDPTRLVARGFGADQPIGDNQTEDGRRQNRRVELVRLP